MTKESDTFRFENILKTTTATILLILMSKVGMHGLTFDGSDPPSASFLKSFMTSVESNLSEVIYNTVEMSSLLKFHSVDCGFTLVQRCPKFFLKRAKNDNWAVGRNNIELWAIPQKRQPYNKKTFWQRF